MRKLKQATQREKARRALKDKKTEPAEAQAESDSPEQRPILHKRSGPATNGKQSGHSAASPFRKVTHH